MSIEMLIGIDYYCSYKAVRRIPKLTIIEYKKCLLLDNTITKFLLFRMKYIINLKCLFDY